MERDDLTKFVIEQAIKQNDAYGDAIEACILRLEKKIEMFMTREQADGFMKPWERGSFTDANGQRVMRGTTVEYRFGARRGTLLEALQDGDAYVMFDDTHQSECVKWINLCKVQ